MSAKPPSKTLLTRYLGESRGGKKFRFTWKVYVNGRRIRRQWIGLFVSSESAREWGILKCRALAKDERRGGAEMKPKKFRGAVKGATKPTGKMLSSVLA